MDWVASFAGLATVAGLICAVVIGVVAFDLRRHLQRGIDELAGRQSQSMRKLTEGLSALQQEQREIQGQIQQLVRNQRKLAADVADLYDRVTDGRNSGQPSDERFLH